MHGTLRTHGTMQVMDPSGHTTITWDASKPVEVDVARSTFERLTREGYTAFEVEGGDQQGRRMREFDPKAGKIMMVPQLFGG
jgi:hypothetical protein